ncbi:sensor histidine kinase [Daejeonella lutea]|uniref:Histidine kinase n=1 Tax=Daejeonella lutea TaxID=572036 RepID=A0A1T5D8I1_9SPHI|nr:histidine kinase [Daejeonella lutea]SKB67810.1 Histidine kinase [Daejeonella lutea]
MNKFQQIFLHVAVWAFLIVLFMFMTTRGSINHTTIIVFIYFGIINISLFYINFLLILPTFLDRKRYLWCGLAIVVVILVFAFIKCGLAYYFYDVILTRVEGDKKTYINFWEYFLITVLVSGFFIFLSTILKFIIDWFRNEKIRSNLENEKLISELAFLKSQINPHFLFNSLNNIYSLAYQKSEKTPEAVLKLSEIMRYMLYESNENLVKLDDEIRYVENYIELQKLRFKEQVHIRFEIDGDTHSKKITPLVLISFVENAFKHGIATDKDNPLTIVLNVKSDKLFFQVINKKSNLNKDDTGGIGLQNVKRRLDLLYKGQYRLHIEDNEAVYNCELYLNL